MIKKIFFLWICFMWFMFCCFSEVEAKSSKPTQNDKNAMVNFLLEDIKNRDLYYNGGDTLIRDMVFQNIYNARYSKIINNSFTGSYCLYMTPKMAINDITPSLYYVDVTFNNGNYTIKYLSDYMITTQKVTDKQKEDIISRLKQQIGNNIFYLNKEETPWTYNESNSLNMDLNFNVYNNFNHLDKVSLTVQIPDYCRNHIVGSGYFCHIPITLSNNKNNATILISGSFKDNKYNFDIDKYLFSSTYYKQKGINTASYWYKLAKNQEIEMNMPEQYLILSWGKPEKINSSTGSWGTHKQYVYARQYVYVENGKITSWQD